MLRFMLLRVNVSGKTVAKIKLIYAANQNEKRKMRSVKMFIFANMKQLLLSAGILLLSCNAFGRAMYATLP
jgi:hypothetical protein